MGWLVALVTIIALAKLALILQRPEAENDWRDGAEGPTAAPGARRRSPLELH